LSYCAFDGRAVLIASWNMRRKRANWDACVAADFDIALLQEAAPPPATLQGHVVYEPLEPGRGSPAGTAVWSRWPLTTLSASRTHPGAAAAAEVATPDGPTTAVSLYALFDYITFANGARKGFAVTTVHRLLSDLTPHLEEPHRRSRLILGGDLNCNPSWDKPGRPTNTLLLSRIEAYALRSVVPILPTDENATFKKRQIDYLFVGNGYAVEAAEVARDGPLTDLSDHHPVVATIGTVA